MGSHGVTCHPVELTFQPLPQHRWYWIQRPWWDARLSRPSVCVQMVRLLLSYGADVNALDNAMNTALHLACQSPQRRLIAFYLAMVSSTHCSLSVCLSVCLSVSACLSVCVCLLVTTVSCAKTAEAIKMALPVTTRVAAVARWPLENNLNV